MNKLTVVKYSLLCLMLGSGIAVSEIEHDVFTGEFEKSSYGFCLPRTESKGEVFAHAADGVKEAYDLYKNNQGPQANIFYGQDGKVHGTVKVDINEQTGRKRITVSYRGTQNGRDWSHNVLAFKTGAEVIGLKGYVHSGFLAYQSESHDAMAALVDRTFQDLTEQGVSSNDVEVLVTGHSLGGAAATVAAQRLKQKFASQSTRFELTTFCSPRVFDQTAAKGFESHFNGPDGIHHIYRVWRKNDIVSAVSFGTSVLGYIAGYKHVGESLALNADSPFYKPLPNHSHGAMVRDTIKVEKVKPDLGHRGIWGHISDATSTLAQPFKSLSRWWKGA